MFMNTMNNRNTLEDVMKHYLIDENDNSTLRQLRSISESEKTEITKQMVDSMTAFTLKRMSNNDYSLISDSRGDITKFEGYKDLKECIVLLRTLLLNTNGDSPINELSTIESTLHNLENQKSYFISGYKLDKRLVIAIYENITTALICSTSFLIATSMDYIKDIKGGVKLIGKKIRNEKEYPTLFFKNMELYNTKSVSGDMIKFYDLCLKNENFSGYTIALSGIFIITTIVPLLREVVYQYFYLRVNLAAYLETQSTFLELNQKNLDQNSDTAKKQRNIANKLLKLSEKINIDQKASSKRAESDVVKENSKMSLSSPTLDNNSNNGHNNYLL